MSDSLHEAHTHSIHSHAHSIHSHTQKNSRKVKWVFGLTVITMFIEILVGTWSGSMALLADGWHMGTHAAAFAISLFVYHYANKHANNPVFSFGTGKVYYLGGFTSAIALAVVALLMAIESLERLINPHSIMFFEAITVAVIGLVVNITSVFILHDDHHHEHHSHHHDHNLKAAYFHVLADALTSLLAIVALFAGQFFGWLWLDALMGIVGAVIISKWAYNLISETSPVLLDKSPVDQKQLKETLEAQHPVVVQNLHIWTVAQQHRAVILGIKTTNNAFCKADFKKSVCQQISGLSHISIEQL